VRQTLLEIDFWALEEVQEMHKEKMKKRSAISLMQILFLACSTLP
jgi:hypothetical protein